jgi:hypothetical protein
MITGPTTNDTLSADITGRRCRIGTLCVMRRRYSQNLVEQRGASSLAWRRLPVLTNVIARDGTHAER